ncbi:MAG: DUF4832 domain-containing protein [Candidatus Sumerlaeaceae bacterium]
MISGRCLLRTAVLLPILGAAISAAYAGTWAPGIQIDGQFDDWDGQVPVLVSDPSGDGATRDVKAVYLANDGQYLYVRIESYNSVSYSGDDLSGIDGDNNTATGYNLFGVGIGSDTLVAGGYVYGEKSGQFNSGSATPSTLVWAQSGNNIEYRLPLSTTIPGDISQSFPGGLGSTIKFVFGDASGSWDYVTPTAYTLSTSQSSIPSPVLESFDAFDSTSNALLRSRDLSSSGCSASRDSQSLGSGNYACAVTHSLDSTAWKVSLVGRRFALPRSIAGHTKITLDVLGSPSATNKNLWVGLVDLDGTYYATTVSYPTTSSWTTVDLGPTSTWLKQADGADGILDLGNIVEWRIGMQNTSSNPGGTFSVAYNNLAAPTGGTTTVIYSEATGDVPNPERGVYRFGGDITDTTIDYNTMAANGYRLVYSQIRLDNYTSSTIPTSYLTSISDGFGRIRSAGMKSIVRIVYNNDGGTASTPPKEASPTYLQQHLNQLKPILAANNDVIAFTFAGIIGAWGEWHSTYYYRDDSQPYQQYNLPSPYWRRQVIDWLIAALPENQFVLIRRPWWKDPAYGSDALFPGEQITEETAFTTAGVARVGHHNDAFLASADDFGTYDSNNIAENKDFLAGDTLYVPIGGETANYDSNYFSCTTCVNEMQQLHWTFFHEDYYPDAVNALKSQGCWDNIKAHLGYRLVLTTATLPSVIRDNEAFSLAFTVENRGWAPAYKRRPMYLVVTNAATGDAVTSVALSSVDVRRWKPGQSISVSLTTAVDLPANPPTNMGLALWLPDENSNLATRPEYCLRFANEGTWDSTRGWNVLTSGGISLPVVTSRLEFE